MDINLYILWTMRLAIVFLMLGIFLPNKRRKIILNKELKRRNAIHTAQQNKFLTWLDKTTENPAVRFFMLEEDSDSYVKLERRIVQAGGMGGLAPNMVQFFKVILPPLGLIVMLGLYSLQLATASVKLTPAYVEQLIEEQNNLGGYLQAKPNPDEIGQVAGLEVNPNMIILIFILSLALYFLPDLIIRLTISNRKKQMKKELPIMETFIVIMLETGYHTVYDILHTLYDTTTFFKPYIGMCLNEYYVNPTRAIQNMANRIQDEEFQVVCNGLKQAVESDKKHTAEFMKQHLDQIKKIQSLQREANIKKKPMVYVFLLALPLASVVTIWFYPWFVQAMKMITTGF